MPALARHKPIDYLVIGHIACDITPTGLSLGGTAAYAALTAQNIGLNVGIVTSWGEEISSPALQAIPIANTKAPKSTTFENHYTPNGRVQIIHHRATLLTAEMIPASWRAALMVHIGPIANETNPNMGLQFSKQFLGLTPQGWMRSWDEDGRVRSDRWQFDEAVFAAANATVVSIEDLNGDEAQIENLAAICPVLAVTEGPQGARVYWNGDVRRFTAPKVTEVNATGAGDIFAASFFAQYFKTRDPYEAAKFANKLAAHSVTRSGLASIPTLSEVKQASIEVF